MTYSVALAPGGRPVTPDDRNGRCAFSSELGGFPKARPNTNRRNQEEVPVPNQPAQVVAGIIEAFKNSRALRITYEVVPFSVHPDQQIVTTLFLRLVPRQIAWVTFQDGCCHVLAHNCVRDFHLPVDNRLGDFGAFLPGYFSGIDPVRPLGHRKGIRRARGGSRNRADSADQYQTQ
jgi:hypothetical protein